MSDYTTAAHMLQLVRRLEGTHSGSLPVNQLAEEFDVHRRTVLRWLAALEDHWTDDDGAPQVMTELRDGRTWAVLTGAHTAVTANIFQYAAAFAATRHLEAGGTTVLSDGAQDVLDRVEEGLPGPLREVVPRVLQSFHYLPFPPKDHSASEATLDSLVRALLKRRKVRLAYTNASNERTQRTIEPWSMVMYRDGLYVLGRVPGEDARRLFAVERMNEVRLTEDTFEVPEDFDPSSEFAPNLGLWRSGREPVRVVIAFAPSTEASVRGRRWPGFQGLTTDDDGRLRLELEVPLTPEITSWVLTWGSTAEVLHPPELRRIVANELRTAAERYTNA